MNNYSSLNFRSQSTPAVPSHLNRPKWALPWQCSKCLQQHYIKLCNRLSTHVVLCSVIIHEEQTQQIHMSQQLTGILLFYTLHYNTTISQSSLHHLVLTASLQESPPLFPSHLHSKSRCTTSHASAVNPDCYAFLHTCTCTPSTHFAPTRSLLPAFLCNENTEINGNHTLSGIPPSGKRLYLGFRHLVPSRLPSPT